MDLISYRIGNFVCYQGEVVSLNKNGLDNTDYVRPLPISEGNIRHIEKKPFLTDTISRVYWLGYSEEDAIVVRFKDMKKGNVEVEIADYMTGERFNLKYLHELQNLVSDRIIQQINISKL